MKRNVVGKSGRQIISGLSKPWSTNPWFSAHRIGAHHGYRIDGAEQAQGSSAGGTPTREYCGAPLNENGQLAALNTWEDDGGRIREE